MALTKEEIVNAIKEMPLLEVAALVKMMETEFGVSAAPVAVAGGGGAAAAAPVEEKTIFDVILKGVDATKKISVIKVVREATGLGLAEAKAFVEAPGKPIKQGLNKADADKLKKQVEEAGGTVEMA